MHATLQGDRPARQREGYAMAMEAGKRAALETILAEAERLLHLAYGSRNTVVAKLIQTVVDEARSTLVGPGQVPSGGSVTAALLQFPTIKSRGLKRRVALTERAEPAPLGT